MQLAFYFDQTRCVGCYACGVACKDWNDVPAGPAKWRRIIHIEEGDFPRPFVAHLSETCNHCQNPLCATVCPANAITKREQDGVVLVDREKCREAARCGIISGYEAPLALTMGEREAPCQVTCPAHLRIPAYIRLIAKGKFGEALDLIRRNMPLPSVCGRICNHPCELQCARNKLDEPLAIASLRRFAADSCQGDLPQPVPLTKGHRVAIVGSGPAGLAAAYDLARMGYGVTIFEALPVAGGMLAVGIPEYRLPKDVLRRDVKYLESLGIEIRTNAPVGPQLTLDQLGRQGYDAFFLGTGSHRGTMLKIPGLDGGMVLSGVSFLKQVNAGQPVAIGRKVLVLGGGNVAFDCARTALRLGAKEVHVACPEAREEMPAFPEEIEQAEQEGVVIHPSRTFTRGLCQDGCATGVECLTLRSMRFDERGALQFDAIVGSEHVLECDTLIMAVGQAPDLDYLKASGGLKVTRRGTIAVDPETMETSRPGVFAGGDAVVRIGTAIEAIAAGQKAAVYIDRYLRGEVLKGGTPSVTVKASDIKVEIPPDTKKAPRAAMPLLPAAERAKSFAEVASGFTEDLARAEAERCLNCAGSLCRDVCPYGSPQFGDEDNAKMQKCNFCIDRWAEKKLPICVAACPLRALDAGPVETLEAKYGGAQETAGFAHSAVTSPPTVFKPKRR